MKMDIDENRLRELVIKAIKLIQTENSKNNVGLLKTKLYVILTEKWNSRYWNFFNEINEQDQYEVYAVISSKVIDNLHINNLKKFRVCRGIINEDNINYDELNEYITVFPLISRNIVVKTALCINDIFETQWIFKAMETGQRIVLLSSGLEKFTGREPKAYLNKILNYYRTLLEFNIEITEKVSGSIHDCCLDTEKEDNKYDAVNDESKKIINSKKRIITCRDIDDYIFEKRIFINAGDIITDMAREKAKSLNISIIIS